MRIAILTHPLGTNYGGILQNYALQQALKELGHDPITLNHFFSIPTNIKIVSLIKRFVLRLIGHRIPLRGWMTDNERTIITQNTSKFIRENINTTKQFELKNKKELVSVDVDAIIVGSDQIWRSIYHDITHFFLIDFKYTNVKKIAYAASFGVDVWELSPKKTLQCKELAKQFTGISVREKSGINLCKSYLGVNAKLVLDPTLLINKNLYYNLANNSSNNFLEKNYIMTYILDKDEKKEEIIKGISKLKNMPFLKVMPEKTFAEVGHKELEKCIYPPIESWLKGFRDCNYVITDSFHGTVFSIIFHKPFIAITNTRRGKDRFVSLLSLLNLENRLVDCYEEAKKIIEAEIDYSKVDTILENKRLESFSFLKENLL